jgi:Amt family ammonium transporter
LSNRFFVNGSSLAPNKTDLAYIFFLFQLGFVAAAATIVSGAMAGRTGFITYLIVALFIGTIIY